MSLNDEIKYQNEDENESDGQLDNDSNDKMIMMQIAILTIALKVHKSMKRTGKQRRYLLESTNE